MQTKLPQVALEFLQTNPSRKSESVLRAFHRWMRDWNIGFKDLRRAHIESFIRCPRGKYLSRVSQGNCRRSLARYLIWLQGKDLLRFDPLQFWGRPKLPFPEVAARYIRSMEPTHKYSTLKAHRVSLRHFHRWLDRHEISLDALQRSHTSAWLQSLSQSGIVPKTINHHLVFVRLYLRWLYEQGILSSYPEELIRVSDMVKEPKYLPRPLPPAADKQIQERLAKSDDIYCQGLLLMRKTGLRIGELASLENQCVRQDHIGNRFLKVPLGKLNTERLVPIDTTTIALIDKLQGLNETAAIKTFLIETKTGKKSRYSQYLAALGEACKGLETNGKMVTHRLRHSYATTLLNAGMSLVGVMKLLGHNDHRMTLRYAEISQETVGKEYFEALARLEHRYADILNIDSRTVQETDPAKLLTDAMHLIQNLSADDNTRKTIARAIVKRIQRIQAEVQKLFPCHSAKP